MKNILYILLFLPLAIFGQDNYSLSFDGVDDYVDFGSNNIFFPSTDYTWQFDFVVRSHYYQSNSVQMHQPFINRSIGYNLDGYGISYGNWGGSTESNYYLWYGQGMNNIKQESWSSDSLITLNNWCNFTVVKSGDSIEIYLDGYVVTSSSILSFDPLINNPTSMLLGATADILNICNVCPDSTFLDGLIDNLTLWNTALNQSEIQNYMTCPPTGNESGLVGYWNFEEGSGTIAFDQTTNGNDGVIYGATYSEDVPESNCFGCTDNLAINYDDLAWENDSSCIYNTYPIEDENFKAYLQSNYPQTIVNDSLNINATLGIEDLNVDSLEISSLDGLQYFYDLINLNCVANNLSTLPELPSQIEYINCQWNQIDTLPDFPESLKNFDGRHNLITVVPALPNTMEVLRVCFNEVTTIPELPDSLKILFCAYNYEQLTYLPDFPDHLEEVLCFDNEIEQISDIPETMYKFMMQNNSITQIPNIPEGVNILNLTNNPIECVNDYPEQFDVQLGSYPPCSFLDEYTALMDSLDQLSNSNDQLQEDLSVFETVVEEQDYSMSFDGVNNSVIIQPSSILDASVTNELTLSSWVKINDTTSLESILRYYPDNLNNPNSGEPNMQYSMSIDNGKIYFIAGAGNININQFEQGYSNQGTSTLSINQWLYITITYDQEYIKFYINGILDYERSIDANFDNKNGGQLFIGSDGIFEQWKLNGGIEDTEIWNKSLTQEQIQSYMSCPPTGEEEGLVGYWDFNESLGDTVYDISGNGNHGVIYGGAEFSEDVPESYNGCTDENALNFEVSALCDNGSCVFGDDVVSNLETSFNETLIGLNNDLDNTNSTLNDVIETWQTSINLTNESLDAISGITQMLNSFNSVIYLSEGWNMIGYGCPEPMDIEESLSDYTDLILIAKANNGSAYLPEYGFNGIGDFTPGYGYQLKTSESIEEFSLCYNYTVIDNTQITEIENDNAQMQIDINCLTGNPQIGDYCYGGIVFYVAEGEEGKYGLVAAIEDVGEFEWGCYGENIDGAEGIFVGSGFQNTIDIASQGCSTESGGITAAQATLDFEYEAYTDWYLPSIDELLVLYQETIGFIVFDNFLNEMYFSSTENQTEYAKFVHFSNGAITPLQGKLNLYQVRPIRAFGNWTMGCMDSLSCNFNEDANMADGSCEFAVEGSECE